MVDKWDMNINYFTPREPRNDFPSYILPYIKMHFYWEAILDVLEKYSSNFEDLIKRMDSCCKVFTFSNIYHRYFKIIKYRLQKRPILPIHCKKNPMGEQNISSSFNVQQTRKIDCIVCEPLCGHKAEAESTCYQCKHWTALMIPPDNYLQSGWP